LRAPNNALDSQTAAVLANAQILENATKDLTAPERTEAFKKTFGDAVQALVDGYAEAGRRIPAELEKLAAAIGAVTAVKFEWAPGIFDALQADSAKARESLAQIHPDFERLNENVRKNAEAFQALGGPITATTGALAANRDAIAGLKEHQATFNEQAAAGAAAYEAFKNAVSSPLDVSNLAALKQELANVAEGARLAKAALDSLINGTEGFPFAAGKPRYETCPPSLPCSRSSAPCRRSARAPAPPLIA
jgi:hypothetical protein